MKFGKSICGSHYDDLVVTTSGFELDYVKVVPKLAIKVKFNDILLSGIFDTGAESVCVKKGYVQGLPRLGSVESSGATGSETSGIYMAKKLRLFFDDNRHLEFRNLPVVALDLPGNTDVLVGQPVIKKFSSFDVRGFRKLVVKL